MRGQGVGRAGKMRGRQASRLLFVSVRINRYATECMSFHLDGYSVIIHSH
jgi:hypothetical protein